MVCLTGEVAVVVADASLCVAVGIGVSFWWTDWQQGGQQGGCAGGKQVRQFLCRGSVMKGFEILGYPQNPTIWLNKQRGTEHLRRGENIRGLNLARFGGLGSHR
jgi:hypothetical protein